MLGQSRPKDDRQRGHLFVKFRVANQSLNSISQICVPIVHQKYINLAFKWEVRSYFESATISLEVAPTPLSPSSREIITRSR